MQHFIDLQKAIDTVNHDIHLHKLDPYGIRGLQINGFKAFHREYLSTQT